MVGDEGRIVIHAGGMASKNSDRERFPRSWLRELLGHDSEVHRIQMLWRRGRGAYMPMVAMSKWPADPTLEPEAGFWEEHEDVETHFLWEFDAEHERFERRAHAEETLEALWSLAGRWVEHCGTCCDFALVGYSGNDWVLFRIGKRVTPKAGAARHQGEGVARVEDGVPLGAMAGLPGDGVVEVVVSGRLVLRVRDEVGLRLVLNALAS